MSQLGQGRRCDDLGRVAAIHSIAEEFPNSQHRGFVPWAVDLLIGVGSVERWAAELEPTLAAIAVESFVGARGIGSRHVCVEPQEIEGVARQARRRPLATDYFFSTFHRKTTGATISPSRFLR